MSMGAGTGEMRLQAKGPRDTKDCGQHLKLEEASKGPPLEVSEGEWPCQHLDFSLPASRTVKE